MIKISTMKANQREIIKAITTTDESILNDLLDKGAALSLDSASLKNERVGGMRIPPLDASNTEWEACLFDGTTFERVNFGGAFFNACTFHGCTFVACDFSGASFDGCVFKRTAMEEPKLDDAELTNCQLQACALKQWHLNETTLESLTISEGEIANLDGTGTLKSVVLRGVSVNGAETREMDVSMCTASACSSVPAGFKAVEGKRKRLG